MPNSPLGKPHAVIDAENQAKDDQQFVRVFCSFCPQWQVEGTVADCRTAAASHRLNDHPQLKVEKRRRSRLTRFNPGLESDRLAGEQNAAEVAKMLASRQVA